MKLKEPSRWADLLKIACLAVILGAGTGTVVAEDYAPSFTVAVISDAAQGRMIIREKYESAISKLELLNTTGISGFYAASNLCVAYLKVGDLFSAEETCKHAVEKIRAVIDSDSDQSRFTAESKAYRRYLAIALSNRGVAYAFNRRPDLARQDFHAAIGIKSRVREPEINLVRLLQLVAPSA